MLFEPVQFVHCTVVDLFVTLYNRPAQRLIVGPAGVMGWRDVSEDVREGVMEEVGYRDSAPSKHKQISKKKTFYQRFSNERQ